MSEVEDDEDVELLSEVVLGGRVVDEVSPGVDTGVELWKDHQMSNFHHCCHGRRRTLTAAVGGQMSVCQLGDLEFGRDDEQFARGL